MIGPYGVGLWKNISQGWPSFSCHILYDIGDGSGVKFWQDRWCGENSIAVRYPNLFRFCRNKDANVAVVLGLFGVSWVMPHSVLGLLWCWQGSFDHHRNGYIWSIIPHCLLWCLWRERNSRCFEDTERSIPDLKLLFFRTLRDWLFALQDKSFPSFIDFLDSCNFCI